MRRDAELALITYPLDERRTSIFDFRRSWLESSNCMLVDGPLIEVVLSHDVAGRNCVASQLNDIKDTDLFLGGLAPNLTEESSQQKLRNIVLIFSGHESCLHGV